MFILSFIVAVFAAAWCVLLFFLFNGDKQSLKKNYNHHPPTHPTSQDYNFSKNKKTSIRKCDEGHLEIFIQSSIKVCHVQSVLQCSK